MAENWNSASTEHDDDAGAGDNTPSNTAGLRAPWKPGQSGNPYGRPKGSRNKLGEEFIQALAADFEEHGVAVIRQVRETRPEVYLKVVAALLPKDVNLSVDPYAEMTDEQLLRRLDQLREATDPLIAQMRRSKAGGPGSETLQ
jgi:hypothetical protein